MGGRSRRLRNQARREGTWGAAPVTVPEPAKTEAKTKKTKKKAKKKTTTKAEEL